MNRSASIHSQNKFTISFSHDMEQELEKSLLFDDAGNSVGDANTIKVATVRPGFHMLVARTEPNYMPSYEFDLRNMPLTFSFCLSGNLEINFIQGRGKRTAQLVNERGVNALMCMERSKGYSHYCSEDRINAVTLLLRREIVEEYLAQEMGTIPDDCRKILRGQDSPISLSMTSRMYQVAAEPFAHRYEGGMGPEFDGSLRISGSASGPLVSEKLFGGLAMMVKKRGGYIENLYSDDRYNDETLSGARGSLVWTPVDSLKMTAGLAYTDVDAKGAAILLPMNEAAAARLGQSYGEWETDINDEGFNCVQNLAPNLKIDYDAGMADIVSVSTYRKSKQDFEYDFDLTNIAALIGVNEATSESWSQELRVQSKDYNNSRFQWMAGYYHSAFTRNQAIGVGASGAAIPIMLDGELRGYGDALFAQGTFRMLDKKLGVTLGGRQEWTNRQVHDATGVFYPDAEMNDSQFLPRLAVDYRFTPEIMAYASIAQGWRSGGFNHLNTAPGKLRFKKETCWTYELGAKTRFLEDRLTFNTSVYHSVYSDYQDRLRTGMMAFYLGNAKKVEMTGMEIDMEALLTDNLQLLASLGYVHAEYTDYKDAINNYSGNTAVMVPDFDMNVALKYTFLDHYYVRPEVQGVGKIYWDRLNTKSQDPYCLLNMRVGYAKDEWEVYAFGENLTNEYKFTDAVDFFADGNWYGNPITPMRFGLGVNFNI